MRESQYIHYYLTGYHSLTYRELKGLPQETSEGRENFNALYRTKDNIIKSQETSEGRQKFTGSTELRVTALRTYGKQTKVNV